VPLHTVIIPCYNSSYLPLSVFSLLSQTQADLEVLIVDNFSSSPAVHSFLRASLPNRVRVFFLTHNFGPGYARNYGIRQADCRYLHFLDDDDFLLPFHLEQSEALHQSSASRLTVSPYFRIFTNSLFSSKLITPKPVVTYNDLRSYNHIPLLTASIDTKISRVPFFIEDVPKQQYLTRPEDYLFWLDLFRANHATVAVTSKKPSAIYSIRHNQRSRNKYQAYRRSLQVASSHYGFNYFQKLSFSFNYFSHHLLSKSPSELFSNLSLIFS